MKHARIIDGVAVDVIGTDPYDTFHPTLAAEFVEVPDEVESGFRVNGEGIWSAPAAEAHPEVAPKVSPIEFKLLWRSAERVALERFRRGADPESADTRDAVNDFFNLLEDPRLTFVDLGLASTRDGVESVLQLLQVLGAVQDVAARKAEIMSGVVQ